MLLRERPDLALALLRDLLRLPVPEAKVVRVGDGDVSQALPVELRADMVIEVEGDGGMVMAIIVESQVQPDARKHFSWPLYVASLHARLRCPVHLLVLAASKRVARWAAKPIDTFQPGSKFAPIVLGPGDVPPMSVEEAAAMPELAVMSVMTRSRLPGGLELTRGVLRGLQAIETDRAILYTDLIMGSLPGPMRSVLEAEMKPEGYEYQSEFARRYFRDRERAREDGQLRGARAALFQLVEARLGQVPEHIRDRVEGCHDLNRLLQWVAAVGSAANPAGDIFEE